tara:strand:+ start:15105 stop:18902 length:3798 start_codon:yes stop_codon:yes gene_type:complete
MKKTKSKKLNKKIKISKTKCENFLNSKNHINSIINIAETIDFDEEGKLLISCLKELKKMEADNKKSFSETDNSLYPHLNDQYFNQKIFQKREFNETKMEEIPNIKGKPKEFQEITDKLCKDKEFELAPHQMFVRNFLSFQTPYNSLLLYHGVGTGKTCSAISVCEEMREYNKQMNTDKEIMIVASPNVQTNFKLQLFNEKKLKEINGLWNIKSCTGNKFLKEINPMNMKGVPKSDVIKQINRIIKQNYKFIGYTEFSNYINKILEKNKHKKDGGKKAIQNEFSNRMLVIDEVHNIRNVEQKTFKKSGENLQKLVVYANNLKLLLLSATPMFDNAREIVWLLNLMNLNDNRFPITENEIFDKFDNLLPGNMDGNTGEALLIQKCTGYISYVRGENVFTFPYRIYPKEMGEPRSLIKLMKSDRDVWQYPIKQANEGIISPMDHIDYLDIMMITITPHQNKIYNFIIKYLKEKKRGFIKKEDQKTGIQYTYLEGLIQSLNFSYPHNEFVEDGTGNNYNIITKLYGNGGLKRNMMFKKDILIGTFEYKHNTITKFRAIFSPDEIKKYSHKINFIIKKIINDKGKEQSKGKILIYSRYIYGSSIPMALALEELGFSRYGGNSLFKNKPKNDYTKNNKLNLKYAMITGDNNLSPNRLEEINAFNSPDNINGEKIKVIIVSKAASEGLDFQNIRQVHILDPWFNIYRIEQIIGRAVRNQSHCLLPFKERNVEIYMHGTQLEDKTYESVDLYMYRLAEKKVKSIAAVSKILKENAVDCFLNSNQGKLTVKELNNTKVTQILSSNSYAPIDYILGHKDNTAVCEFDKCKIKCNKENEKIKENSDTYNNYYMVLNIDKIIQRIRLLFKEEYIYSDNELITRIQQIKKYPREQIYYALDQLINNENEYLADMYGKIGKVKNIDNYYFFQPIEINDYTQIYDNKHLIDEKNEKIVYPLPENIKEKSISKTKKITEILTKLKIEMDKIQNPKKLQSTDKQDNSKIAAWMIKILHQLNGIPKDNLYRYALYHILEGFNHDDKLLLLNHVYGDKYANGIKYEEYSKKYFEKFIHNNRIGLFDDKIKYYELAGNKWIRLPSNKTTKLNEMYINKKTSHDKIGVFDINKGKTYFKIKNMNDKKKRTGATCGTGEFQKKEMINLNNEMFKLLHSDIELQNFMTRVPTLSSIIKKDINKYNHTASKIDTIYGMKLKDIVDKESKDGKFLLQVGVKGKKKEVIPIRLTSKHLCVENELLLHYLEEKEKDNKKWLYYNIEKIINKI